MYNSGYVRSVVFGAPCFEPKESSTLPDSLDLRNQVGPAINQGVRGICVSACVTDMLKYIYAGTEQKYKKPVDFFYNRRGDKKVDGMSPRNAFEIAQANGLIQSYATLKSILAIKIAMLANGPVLIALPVYQLDSDFWRKREPNDKPQGYHAVTLAGFYEKDQEFLLRNSWGVTWGLEGYSYFPYRDQDLIMEAWTIFK